MSIGGAIDFKHPGCERESVGKIKKRGAAANRVSVVECGVADAQIEVQQAAAAFRAGKNCAEGPMDGDGARFADLISQEVRRHGLRLQIFHGTKKLLPHSQEKGRTYGLGQRAKGEDAEEQEDRNAENGLAITH